MRWLAALLPLLASASAPPSADLLVGTWRLVRYVDTPTGAAPVMAFGAHPTGQFVFTADGHASVNIMRNPPGGAAAAFDPDPDACVPEWYCSYFGTYTVAPDQRSWTIHVVGANIPSFIGTDQTRPFRITGGRLILSGSYQAAGRTVTLERVLERER